MLGLRKEHKDVFVYGTFELLEPDSRETFVYRKWYDDKMGIVALNFTTNSLHLPEKEIKDMKLLISSCRRDCHESLQPLEGRVYINY